MRQNDAYMVLCPLPREGLAQGQKLPCPEGYRGRAGIVAQRIWCMLMDTQEVGLLQWPV